MKAAVGVPTAWRAWVRHRIGGSPRRCSSSAFGTFVGVRLQLLALDGELVAVT
ncbi:hypothetical protein [Streptomyces inhibens]|uniref:hypothetical protein n=1 Tax=Streptomyces inhibens TaxID=2293571 RepID=UPI001EE7566D|nr:hypothetical protein [Streptomyces inhibens]UKY48339.1 hypothetical protein KI385_05685 [Streptomyces inhibens]